MNKYNIFKNELISLKKQNIVEIFYRGEDAKKEFHILDEEFEDYNVESFAKKLFYFGQKSQHFWKNEVQNKIPLNDISAETFRYVFNEYNKLKTAKGSAILNFRKANKESFDYFFNPANRKDFVDECMRLSPDDRKNTRNYLFIVLHRMGRFPSYKKKSHFLSATSNPEIAEKFAEEIIITFWNPFIRIIREYQSIFKFDSIIHWDQKENSVFSAIFPHYILSFKYKGVEYFNPSIENCSDSRQCILNGLDINQNDFIERLYKETNYEKGVKTKNHIVYSEQ